MSDKLDELMAETQTVLKSEVIELAGAAFDAFCEDMSAMFGAESECEQEQACFETAAGLKKRFKNTVVVSTVKSEGALNGSFHILIDQDGLFTLAGVVVMLPEQKIMQNRKGGSESDIAAMQDATKEVSNLLVGSWDRVFREEFEGHRPFKLGNVFIGKPWQEPEQKIGLSSTAELVFAGFKVTVDPFAAFKCGVIFEKAMLGEEAIAAARQAGGEKKVESEKPAESGAKQEQPAEDIQPQTIEQAGLSPGAGEQKEPEKPQAGAEAAEPAQPEVQQTPVGQNEGAEPGTVAEKVSAEGQQAGEKLSEQSGPVSKAIQEIVQSAAILPGQDVQDVKAVGTVSIAAAALAGIEAKDVMRVDVVWAGPDDTVEQTLAKIQQHKTKYILVGNDGVLEGIISDCDIQDALSPYLKPMFSKWRRPLDEATLQIKVRWVMSKPVQTVRPETPLSSVISNMCGHESGCLPVVDEKGKVYGIVSTADVLGWLLKNPVKAGN